MIRRTLAEIEAESRKAARGFGCPWGMAEEAGKAARRLASQGAPGPEALAEMLAERRACCCDSGPPCPLRTGAALSDAGIAPEPDAPLLVSAIAGPETPPGSPESRFVDPEAWRILRRFAGRTYAPATEASRQSGAGAGTSDND